MLQVAYSKKYSSNKIESKILRSPLSAVPGRKRPLRGPGRPEPMAKPAAVTEAGCCAAEAQGTALSGLHKSLASHQTSESTLNRHVLNCKNQELVFLNLVLNVMPEDLKTIALPP